MNTDTLIQNGTIVTANSTYQADILVRDGKILQIGQNLYAPDYSILDASGQYVLPGGIDAHTHMQMPFQDAINADTYATGTMAAACGGITMIFDYVLQEKGEGLLQAVGRRKDLCAPQAYIDYSFHTGISDLTPAVLEEIAASVACGVPSFKAYMVYDFALDDADLYRLLLRAKQTGALIAVHCENRAMLQKNIQEMTKNGTTSPWDHYQSRDEVVEGEAINRAVFLAKSVGAPLYVVHLACEQGLETIAQARKQGYAVYAETCPHYLCFTNEVYKRPDGQNFVCSPAMKGARSQAALWAGVQAGWIDTVATDHCPFTAQAKAQFQYDFPNIPNGCMGVETMYPYMLCCAQENKLTYNKAVELCATNPAKLFGCAHRKGSIEVGLDADLVLYDPNGSFCVTQSAMHSLTDYTIYEGLTLKGRITATLCRGKLVYQNGAFLGEQGYGAFVPCKPHCVP